MDCICSGTGWASVALSVIFLRKPHGEWGKGETYGLVGAAPIVSGPAGSAAGGFGRTLKSVAGVVAVAEAGQITTAVAVAGSGRMHWSAAAVVAVQKVHHPAAAPAAQTIPHSAAESAVAQAVQIILSSVVLAAAVCSARIIRLQLWFECCFHRQRDHHRWSRPACFQSRKPWLGWD